MKETFKDFFFSAKVKGSTSSQIFFPSLNNLSEAELSKVAKGLRTIVRRLNEAPIIFTFDFFSAKKGMFFRFTSLVPQKKGKKE